MTDILARMRQIIGTTADWAANDRVLGDGELALERTVDNKVLAKVGNGIAAFSTSPYLTVGGAAAMPPADILAALLTVDGPGSNLNADLLDNQDGLWYLDLANASGTLAVARLPATVARWDTINGWTQPQQLISAFPTLQWWETDATPDNKLWDITVNSEQLYMRAVNDAVSAANSWLTVDRTGIVIDRISLNSVQLFWNGAQLPAGNTGNTWTGLNNFTAGVTFTDVVFFSGPAPRALWSETDAAVDYKLWDFIANGSVFYGRCVNDAASVANPWISISRVGAVPATITVGGSTVINHALSQTSAVSFAPTHTLTNTNDDGAPASITIRKLSGSRNTVAGDNLGSIDFYGKGSGGTSVFGGGLIVSAAANGLGGSIPTILTLRAYDTGGTLRSIIVATDKVTVGGNLRPSVDNAYSFGEASLRSSVVYSATAAINTSDQREKTALAPISPALKAAIWELMPKIGVYQWLDSVEHKGPDAARLHIGLTAQVVYEVFTKHGLDPRRYAFFCEDEIWEEIDVEVPVTHTIGMTKQVEEMEIVYEGGTAVQKKVMKEIPDMESLPLFDENGKPVMDVIKTPGEPDKLVQVTFTRQKTRDVPGVTVRKETVRKLDPAGRPYVRLGLRYEQLILLALAAGPAPK